MTVPACSFVYCKWPEITSTCFHSVILSAYSP